MVIVKQFIISSSLTCFKGFILKLSLFLNIANICFMTNIIIYVINSRYMYKLCVFAVCWVI